MFKGLDTTVDFSANFHSTWFYSDSVLNPGVFVELFLDVFVFAEFESWIYDLICGNRCAHYASPPWED